MATDQYFKITDCTAADNYALGFYSNAACDADEALAASNCIVNYFSNSALSMGITDVVIDHTVSQPVAAETTDDTTAADTTTEDSAKTLVAGSLAAISLMYL